MESLSPPVSWRGLRAFYTPEERDLMAQLPVKEQFVVHTLKAFTPGELAEGDRLGNPANRVGDSSSSHNAEVTSGGGSSGRSAPVYTDPEDIPFGEKPKRRPKIYAVAWTWRKHKIHKTKKRCEERLKVWKKWKERQGWTVKRMGSGYWAELGDLCEVIQLHEYDRETRERL